MLFVGLTTKMDDVATGPKSGVLTSQLVWDRVPSALRQLYVYLRNERKWSELFILAAFLAVPIVMGMGSTCHYALSLPEAHSSSVFIQP